jgi:hypothetical protein
LPIIQELRRLRQEGGVFKESLGYTKRPYLRKQNNKKLHSYCNLSSQMAEAG